MNLWWLLGMYAMVTLANGVWWGVQQAVDFFSDEPKLPEAAEFPSRDEVFCCPSCGRDTRFSAEWYEANPQWKPEAFHDGPR